MFEEVETPVSHGYKNTSFSSSTTAGGLTVGGSFAYGSGEEEEGDGTPLHGTFKDQQAPLFWQEQLKTIIEIDDADLLLELFHRTPSAKTFIDDPFLPLDEVTSDMTIKFLTPIEYSSYRGSILTTEVLLRLGANIGAGEEESSTALTPEPLTFAVRAVRIEIVRVLLAEIRKRQKDEEGTPLLSSLLNKQLRCGSTLLHLIVNHGSNHYSPLVLNELLKAGADPRKVDHHGSNPLHWLAVDTTTQRTSAAYDGALRMLHLIFSSLPPADLRELITQGTITQRETPLHWAAERGNFDFALALVKKIHQLWVTPLTTPLLILNDSGLTPRMIAKAQHPEKTDLIDLLDGATPDSLPRRTDFDDRLQEALQQVKKYKKANSELLDVVHRLQMEVKDRSNHRRQNNSEHFEQLNKSLEEIQFLQMTLEDTKLKDLESKSQLVEEHLSCTVCSEAYSATDPSKRPCLCRECGNTFCAECLVDPRIKVCPACRSLNFVGNDDDGGRKLVCNFALMKVIEHGSTGLALPPHV